MAIDLFFKALYQMSKIDKHFVSDIDTKMAEFDATHPLSATQAAEHKKYQQIYARRDTATNADNSNNLPVDLWQ